MEYTYWNNREKWNGEQIITVLAETLTEADIKFQKTTNIDPLTHPYIGVTIHKGCHNGE